MDSQEAGRKAEISLRIMEYQIDENDLPSVDDALIIGKRAPIGTDGAKKIVELISPGKYEVIKVEHSLIDSIIIRKVLLSMIPREKLMPVIIEESGKMIHESIILKAQIVIILHINRIIDV